MSIANLLVPNDYQIYINNANIVSYKARMNQDQTSPNGTYIILGANGNYQEEWNYGGFTEVNGVITIPSTGRYLIDANVTFLMGGTAGNTVLQNLQVNSITNSDSVVLNIEAYVQPTSTAPKTSGLSGVVYLEEGATVYLYCQTVNNGTTTTWRGDSVIEYTNICIFKLF